MYNICVFMSVEKIGLNEALWIILASIVKTSQVEKVKCCRLKS